MDCFLLTRQWRDGRDGLELVFWAASAEGPVRVVITGEEAVCFVDRDNDLDLTSLGDAGFRRQPLELQTLDGRAVDGLYFRSQRDLVATRNSLRRRGMRLYESDIKPSDRYLMERFITAGFAVHGEPRRRDHYVQFINPTLRRAEFSPSLQLVSIDIETAGLEGELYSVAVSSPRDSRVFLVGESVQSTNGVPIECCRDERRVIEAFFVWLEHFDPDLILGWNVINFDLDFLERKCRALGIPFAIGRGDERATILQAQGPGGTRVARVPGRAVIDGIDALRAAFHSFESFELQTVSQALLGRGKRIKSDRDKVAEIQRLFREEKAQLAAYNLEDCRLVADIFAKADLVNFAVRKAELTGLAMDRYGGAVAAFDNLYLPRLHRRGRVAPDVGDADAGPGSPGGYVMDSKPGLYDDVLLLDFKSLYPSIIRTFRIDPLGLASPGDDPVPGFLDAMFSRGSSILPELIEGLWQARDEAKRHRDAALSQAVKILMNSFYGVMGANGCRFYDARLASSITRRGHEIIQATRQFIEGQGYDVIYGDTDSVFVLVDDERSPTNGARAIGTRLATELNRWWRDRLMDEHRLQSFLEIEFETHYLRFLMPTVRGDKTGSKKRYAGLVRDVDGTYEVVFKGLESVRTDWTPLARQFQRELYRRVFLREPFEAFIRETLADLLAGRLDRELVYRKRLRRPLEDYIRNVPPHVQAARKLARPGRWVRYVITKSGPEPVEDEIPKPDYEHYRERQLGPAADGILYFLGTSFETITDAQLSIF